MFFTAPPVVDLIDLKQNQVVFTSKKALRVGRDTPVRLSAQAPEGDAQLIPSRIFVQQARPLAGGQVAYVGTLQTELPFQPVPVNNGDSDSLRRGARFDLSLRVMSPDLPDFGGVTVDFSLTGLQLETRSAVSTGEVVRLTLDTNIEELEYISLSARVAWSRPEGRKSHRCGLEFRDLTPEVRDQLEELGRYLRARETANLTELVLERADRYLLGYTTPVAAE
ncbi:PilZ domain-containing protein [bacterium]|nr:PilZ domain-containing protein [bacterium]